MAPGTLRAAPHGRTVPHRAVPSVTVKRSLALGVAVLVLGAGGVVGLAVVGDDPSGRTQRWTDFDRPPWTRGIEVGRTYEYSVNTHCGVHAARIDGTNWRAEPPVDDGMGNPPPGWAHVGGVGTLEIVDRNTAVFENGPLAVTFVRDDLPETPCG